MQPVSDATVTAPHAKSSHFLISARNVALEGAKLSEVSHCNWAAVGIIAKTSPFCLKPEGGQFLPKHRTGWSGGNFFFFFFFTGFFFAGFSFASVADLASDFADGFAYDDAKKKITIFINENASIKFVKADVTVNLSDEYTSNGVSSIITASGSGSATSDGAVSSIFTMIDNAYNPACNAAKDSLSTHAGLLNHGVIHSQQVGAKPVGPKE